MFDPNTTYAVVPEDGCGAMVDVFPKEFLDKEGYDFGLGHHVLPLPKAIEFIKSCRDEKGFVCLDEIKDKEIINYLIENKMVIVAPQYENEFGEPNYPTYMDERK